MLQDLEAYELYEQGYGTITESDACFFYLNTILYSVFETALEQYFSKLKAYLVFHRLFQLPRPSNFVHILPFVQFQPTFHDTHQCYVYFCVISVCLGFTCI